MDCISDLDGLADLVRKHPDLYLRWSAGPDADARETSRDELTGVELPGLSANALAVPLWWRDRPVRAWVARRLYDYEHLQRRRAGARPWVLSGRECGRGPDNEPLVTDVSPVAWVAPEVADEARRVIEAMPADWGSLDRTGSNET
ncbi:MAG TPA: DUF6098 family protein [Acidimicrobiales bacterium]|nr:DUF6098 family protein [Acidimicrobiales bacterium]